MRRLWCNQNHPKERDILVFQPILKHPELSLMEYFLYGQCALKTVFDNGIGALAEVYTIGRYYGSTYLTTFSKYVFFSSSFLNINVLLFRLVII